ncbi:DUF423 domain-containing protein [Gammaproteobacteria bacterium]
MTPRATLQWGALNGLLAVAAGAFAAHGLKSQLPADLLAIWQTGVQYQAMHALALLAVGLLTLQHPSRAGRLAGWLFLGGIIIFSGSLYLLALIGVRWLGVITPLGGAAFLGGWLAFLVAARNLPISSPLA